MIASVAAAAALAQPSLPPLKATAWMVLWNPKSMESFQQNAGKLDEIKLEWIGLDAEGQPERRPHGTPEEHRRFHQIAKANKVRTYAMVSNYAVDAGGFDAKRVQKMLASPTARARHIKELVAITTQDGFDGIDLDIESLTEPDREAFSGYVEELGRALKNAKKGFTVTVHPKESEPGGWDGPKAQDYARIGRAADVVKIMTYDFSWAGSPEPGPIAPTDWVERVMTHAKSQIPAQKLDMGVAAYGYDWSQKPAASLTWTSFGEQGQFAQPCPRSSELIAGKAYFSGSAAFEAKYRLAQKLGLRGFAMWYVGSEDPGMWNSKLLARP